MSKLTYHLKVVSRYSRLFKNELLQPLGLVNREAEIIMSIRRKPGRSQDDIAEDLLINKSSVARCLASMEERGLVVRTVSPADRRVTLVDLSETAEALVRQIREVNEKWSEFVTDGLTEEEQAVFLRILENVSVRAHDATVGRRKKL